MLFQPEMALVMHLVYYFSKRKLKYFYTFNNFYGEKSSKKAKQNKSATMTPNLQSPQRESTPRRLTLLTHLSLGKSIQTLRELVFCNYISFCEQLCSLQNQYQISHQCCNVRNILKLYVIKIVNYIFSIVQLQGVLHFALDGYSSNQITKNQISI